MEMRIAALAALGILIASSPVVHAAELKIFTPRAGATVLEKLAPAFERGTGNKVAVTMDAGPVLVTRITAGEPFDILIAGTPIIDAQVAKGVLIGDSRKNLFRSGLGIEVRAGAPKPDIGSVDKLKQALLNAKSIAFLKGVNGVEGIIERLGLSDALKSKLAPQTRDIVSDLVAKGEADLAITAITQIVTTPGVDLVGPMPPELQFYIQFVAAIGTGCRDQAAARELIKFLGSPAAIRVIKSQGMEPS